MKIDNNALFAQQLQNNPPQYKIGDIVSTNSGIGQIVNYVFNEREKSWKYTIKPYGLNNFYMDVAAVYCKTNI